MVDDRVGSRHYADLLGDKAIIGRLEAADIAFESNGVSVGIEVKKVLDAVNCLYSGRLADHQIPLLRRSYDHAYLIVEGIWRAEPGTGILQYYKGELGKWGKWIDVTSGQKRLLASSFESWLQSMTVLAGVMFRSTPGPIETASLLTSLERWYSKSSHGSFNVMQESNPVAELTRPTMLRRVIALLPRVGWARSAVLAQRFRSVSELACAEPHQFLIENEIAMPTAIKIVEALRGDQST